MPPTAPNFVLLTGMSEGSSSFQMQVASVWHNDASRVNSMTFHSSGETLATASDDGTLQIAACLYETCDTPRVYWMTFNREPKKIYCKKYGIANVKFTHHQSAILASSYQKFDRTFSSFCHH